MVMISAETLEQTGARLERVISHCDLVDYSRPYAFAEFALDAFPGAVSEDALALIRDDDGWSQLVPARGDEDENFRIWRFHFRPGDDNSGFVGWLSSKIKNDFGSGVIVICGYNASRAGVYDYYGCPWSIGDDVIESIRQLCRGVA